MAFRRGFRRGARRSWRRRPKTYWLTGVSFSFDTSRFPLVEVQDGGGLPICASAEVPIISVDDFLQHGGDGFILHRIVGQIRHIVLATDEQGTAVVEQDGADVRRSIQKRRVYQNTALSALEGEQLHSHLFSQTELGDEDILTTSAFFQPSLLQETTLRTLQLALDSHLVTENFDPAGGGVINTFDTWSNFFADQLGPSVRDIDIRCRRKVLQDDVPFLYYDVRTAIGGPLSVATGPQLALQGYLRMLVTKGR